MITVASPNKLTLQVSTRAVIERSVSMFGYRLPVKIEADFKDIPSHLHEEFAQVLLYSYSDMNVSGGSMSQDEILNHIVDPKMPKEGIRDGIKLYIVNSLKGMFKDSSWI